MLRTGTRLAHYEILASIGAGGMGEVYRAEDTKLRRQIALKILPGEFATDATRRERFTREAQAIAALNHPNIVTLHSVEEAGETHFLTMELVEGTTVAARLPRNGFTLAELLKIAVPLADGVSAAHERGIVHRDLKPGNVMLTADGRVKILDFGLAKLKGERLADLATRTDIVPESLTGEGRIVGTVAYMSPEQAEGNPVDHRSDIFSLGVLLYEMATGQRPFTGDSMLSVVSAIIKDTPPSLVEKNPSLPTEFAKIVRRCLAKDPAKRFQSAADLRNELEELRQEIDSGESSGSATAVTPGRVPRRALRAGGIAVVLAVGLTAGYIVWRNNQVSPNGVPMVASFTQLTSAPGSEAGPSLSPDGRWLVYGSDASGNLDIYLQSVGGQSPIPINLTRESADADDEPAFSPDGELVAFHSTRGGGGIYVMGRTGESARRVTDGGRTPAWAPDGKSIFYSTLSVRDPQSRAGSIGELWRVELVTGRTSRISAGDVMNPSVSPQGLRIAYWALAVTDEAQPRVTGLQRDIWTIRTDGTDPVRVTNDLATDWNPIWSHDGTHILFASDRGGTMNLWRVLIDEATGRVGGEPEPITTPAPYLGHIARSADGRRLAYASFTYARSVDTITFDPVKEVVQGTPRAVTTGTQYWAFPDISPDGGELVMQSYYRQQDIYAIRVDGNGLRQLTNDVEKDWNPRWSRDGKRVVFHSERSGGRIWVINADGSGLRPLVDPALSRRLLLWHPVLSPDGRRLLVNNANTRESYMFPVDEHPATAPIETLPQYSGQLLFPAWSPDGHRIAGNGLWIYALDSKSYVRITDEGDGPSWFSDSRRLLYFHANPDRCVLLDTVSKQSSDILSFPNLASCRVSADNRMIVFTRATTSADIWLLAFKPPE